MWKAIKELGIFILHNIGSAISVSRPNRSLVVLVYELMKSNVKDQGSENTSPGPTGVGMFSMVLKSGEATYVLGNYYKG